MGTLTIRLPDEKHERLRQLAAQRNMSLNTLIEELFTAVLTEFDLESRFQARAALGSPERGLQLLAKLEETGGLRESGMKAQEQVNAVKTMREIREEISRETQGMSFEQAREYIDKHLRFRG